MGEIFGSLFFCFFPPLLQYHTEYLVLVVVWWFLGSPWPLHVWANLWTNFFHEIWLARLTVPILCQSCVLSFSCFGSNSYLVTRGQSSTATIYGSLSFLFLISSSLNMGRTKSKQFADIFLYMLVHIFSLLFLFTYAYPVTINMITWAHI